MEIKMKYLKTFKKLLEGIGDKYAENRFGIPNKEDEFEMKYQQSRNQDPIATSVVRGKTISIYKNPINLSGFANGCRGVVSKNGDLFIASTMEGVIHTDILQIIKKKGYIKSNATNWEDIENTPNVDFVCVQRIWDKKEFAIAESYAIPKKRKIEEREKVLLFIKNIFDAAKSKNPRYNFILQEFRVAIKNSLSPNQLKKFREKEFKKQPLP
jgi:hypothetical protein